MLIIEEKNDDKTHPDYVPTVFSYSTTNEIRQVKWKLEWFEG